MSGNPRPWRIMTVVFGGVLLCSFAISKLFSPAGDAALRALDARPASVIGVIAASPSEPGKLALAGGASWYILSDQTKARVFAGRKVRVIGILHESTGLLELRSIDPLPRSDHPGTFALDRAPDTP
jgi:hypothetical protein